MAISTTVNLPKANDTVPTAYAVTVGSGVESGTTNTFPIRLASASPTSVIAGTSTTSPKTITFSAPTNIKIRVGFVISGGSFAGTEVISAVTTNSAGLITAVTYTGTGAINASPVNFTFTGTAYTPKIAFLQLEQVVGGKGQIVFTAKILRTTPSASANSGGDDAATVANAVLGGTFPAIAVSISDFSLGIGQALP